MSARLDELNARGRAKYGDKWDASELVEPWATWYHQDARVMVDYGHETVCGRVSVTGGWRPSFLLMRRTSDIGSAYLLDDRCKLVAVKRDGWRQYLAIRPAESGCYWLFGDPVRVAS